MRLRHSAGDDREVGPMANRAVVLTSRGIFGRGLASGGRRRLVAYQLRVTPSGLDVYWVLGVRRRQTETVAGLRLKGRRSP